MFANMVWNLKLVVDLLVLRLNYTERYRYVVYYTVVSGRCTLYYVEVWLLEFVW